MLQLGGAAGGLEAFERSGIALGVGGPVAAGLVKEDDRVPRYGAQALAQVLQHDLVVAVRVLAQLRIAVVRIVDRADSRANALATGIVVAPLDVESRIHE